MSNVLEVNRLVKRYGDKIALENVTFSVKSGSCFGLLGPNGAGKSTTMKIITSIIEANEGTASVFGKDIRKEADAIRRQVGYVPQDITLYEKLSARDNLTFFGEMYGVRGKELKTRIDEVLKQVGLSERGDDAISTFSGGMKRRINIAAALLHKPKLVILDEPTVGIDPQSRNHIFQMIRELKASGVSMIYSTHYMEEVEALCDDIAIIDHGKVIVQGSLDHLLGTYATQAIYMEAEGLTQAPALPGVNKAYADGKGWVLECSNVLETMGGASRFLEERVLPVKSLEIMRPSLESVFLKLTGTTLRD